MAIPLTKKGIIGVIIVVGFVVWMLCGTMTFLVCTFTALSFAVMGTNTEHDEHALEEYKKLKRKLTLEERAREAQANLDAFLGRSSASDSSSVDGATPDVHVYVDGVKETTEEGGFESIDMSYAEVVESMKQHDGKTGEYGKFFVSPGILIRIQGMLEAKGAVINKLSDNMKTNSILKKALGRWLQAKPDFVTNLLSAVEKSPSMYEGHDPDSVDLSLYRWANALLYTISCMAVFPLLSVLEAPTTDDRQCYSGRDLVDWVFTNLHLSTRRRSSNFAALLVLTGFLVPDDPSVIAKMKSDKKSLLEKADLFNDDSVSMYTWSANHIQRVLPLSHAIREYERRNKAQITYTGALRMLRVRSERLAKRDLDAILRNAPIMHFGAKEIITAYDTPVTHLYYVESGRVRCEFPYEKQSHLYIGEEECIGLPALLRNDPRHCGTAIAEGPTVLRALDLNECIQSLRKKPMVHAQVMASLMRDITVALQLLPNQAYGRATRHTATHSKFSGHSERSGNDMLRNTLAGSDSDSDDDDDDDDDDEKNVGEGDDDDTKKQPERMTKAHKTEKFLKQVKECHRRLGSSVGECVRASNCSMIRSFGTMEIHGHLYLTRTHLCFYARPFGKHVKYVVRYDEIVQFEVTSSLKFQVRARNSKKYAFVHTEDMTPITSYIHDTIDAAVNGASQHSLDSIMTSSESDGQSSGAFERSAPTDGDESIFFAPEGSHPLGMNGGDWSVVMAGAVSKFFQKGDVVVKEGEYGEQLCQIARGSCRVEKRAPNGEVLLLGRLGLDDIFGEISFLHGVPCTATVVADMDTDLYMLRGTFIGTVCMKKPRLAGKFLHSLASRSLVTYEARQKNAYE
eukprot:TRINITY_DN391_c0_g1_i1.p1 TRINITY_DN391_c0_g1~~TRINITY_DN391_c0_g1_i1.p1  ORF type:complete len:853 (+),score=190.81 TRINITY_DN391_c0_g1_i1:159-2717(+)